MALNSDSHKRLPATTRGLWYPDDDSDLLDPSGAQPPKKLLFSLTGKCNLRCDHCPRGVLEVRASETPNELVDHVIENLLPIVRSVRLGGTDLGEQLTSRNFNRFLEAVLANQPKHLEIVSNLTVMDRPRADLIAAACDDFGLSLEGVGDSFERVRHFPWSRIEGHLDLLLEAQRSNPQSRLNVFCLVTCFRDNLDELPEILELAHRGIGRFEFRLFQPTIPEQSSQMLENHQREANRMFRRLRRRAEELGVRASVPDDFPEAPLVLAERGVATESERRSGRNWVCHFPFEAVSIYSDGRMSPCCEEIVLGRLDLTKPDVVRAFQEPQWRQLRESLMNGTYTGRCVECGLRKSRQAELDRSPEVS